MGHLRKTTLIWARQAMSLRAPDQLPSQPRRMQR